MEGMISTQRMRDSQPPPDPGKKRHTRAGADYPLHALHARRTGGKALARNDFPPDPG